MPKCVWTAKKVFSSLRAVRRCAFRVILAKFNRVGLNLLVSSALQANSRILLVNKPAHPAPKATISPLKAQHRAINAFQGSFLTKVAGYNAKAVRVESTLKMLEKWSARPAPKDFISQVLGKHLAFRAFLDKFNRVGLSLLVSSALQADSRILLVNRPAKPVPQDNTSLSLAKRLAFRAFLACLLSKMAESNVKSVLQGSMLPMKNP